MRSRLITAALVVVLLGMVVALLYVTAGPKFTDRGADEVFRVTRDLSAPPSEETDVLDVRLPELPAQSSRSSVNPSASSDCVVHCSATMHETGLPLAGVSVKLENVETRWSLRAHSATDGTTQLLAPEQGRYALTAEHPQYVLIHSSLGHDLLTLPEGNVPVRLSFVEPYVCAFVCTGEAPYDLRVAEQPRGFHVSRPIGRQPAMLARQLGDLYQCHARIYLLTEVVAQPYHDVTFFCRDRGCVTRQVPLVPLSLLGGPHVVDLGAAPTVAPTSSLVSYKVLDAHGIMMDVGPLRLDRLEPLLGYRHRDLACNTQCEMPFGLYHMATANLWFPWVIKELLPANGQVELVPGRPTELHYHLTEESIRLTLVKHRDALVQVVCLNKSIGDFQQGAAVDVSKQETLLIPSSVTHVAWSLNGQRMAELSADAWQNSGQLLLAK